MQLHRLIASCGGIGYVRGGGTLAAILYGLIWYFLPAAWHRGYPEALLLLLILVTGTWSSDAVESHWGKDSSRVVVDELAGMAISLCWIPVNLVNLLAALVLFRFFDIVKPLGIRRLEQWKGGWGVMADDVLSGIYAWIVLQALMRWLPV
jgi:phosphatidylglycerophosphatase A